MGRKQQKYSKKITNVIEPLLFLFCTFQDNTDFRNKVPTQTPNGSLLTAPLEFNFSSSSAERASVTAAAEVEAELSSSIRSSSAAAAAQQKEHQ